MVAYTFLKSKACFMIYLVMVLTFTVWQATPVDAANACCERTNNGEFCVYTDQSNCDSNYQNQFARCDQTNFCKPVCCLSGEEGSCSPGVGFAQCRSDASNSEFEDASCESVSQCSVGCCTLGSQCFLGTQTQCLNEQANYPDLDGDVWDESIRTEGACTNVCKANVEGCCVSEELCSQTTLSTCSGDFHESETCSSISFCGCEPQHEQRCYEEDVYWYDSCGNKEELVEDCADGNEACQVIDDVAQCASVHCETTYTDNKNVHDSRLGGFRRHGEEWCVYESPTGDFKDIPGSRHFKHLCYNGEEKVEPCRDFREQVCVQSSQLKEGSPFTEADCINNEIYDSPVEEDISTVPRGDKFWSDNSQNRCDEGTTECEIVYVKEFLSGWECEENCECETPEFIDEVATYCGAFGDCGASVNVVDERSDRGLNVQWHGTTKGPRPRHVTEDYWNRFTTYGIFSGMQNLFSGYQTFIEGREPELNFIEANAVPELVYGGAVLSAFGFLSPASWGLSFLGPWGFAPILLAFIFGGTEVKTKTVMIECAAWQPLPGGAHCETCDDDPFKECSEYKCRSLGAACEYFDDTGDCIAIDPNNVNSAVISPWEEALSEGHGITEFSNGYEITGLIAPFTPVKFGIQTDVQTLCKIDNEHTESFDEMSNFFGDAIYGNEHEIALNLPGGKDYQYYVRCENRNGKSNLAEYTIKFATSPEPDKTPPTIESTSIANNAPVQYGASDVPLKLYFNEPAACKWSREDVTYADMTEVFVCNDEVVDDPTFLSLYSCLGILTEIDDNAENNYYFRCEDLAGNVNQDSYPFTLRGTSPLVISDIQPSDTVYDNSPTLTVVTSGGENNGKAICEYSLSGLPANDFFVTDTSLHQQQLQNLDLGSYTYDVSCIDAAGNEAASITTFFVAVDLEGPGVKYLYSDGVKLTIITAEASTCEYSTTAFTFGQGTEMTGTNVETHTLSIQDETYYIICADASGNEAPMITVHP